MKEWSGEGRGVLLWFLRDSEKGFEAGKYGACSNCLYYLLHEYGWKQETCNQMASITFSYSLVIHH